MSPFRKNYLLQCFTIIECLLSNKKQLKQAVLALTQNDPTAPRYHSNKEITDSANWTTTDKVKLTAALFEANAQVSAKVAASSNDDETIKELSTAHNVLLNYYLPLITTNTDPANRLASVQINLKKLKLEIKSIPIIQPEVSPEMSSYTYKNPNNFFQAAFIISGIATTLAATAIILSKR